MLTPGGANKSLMFHSILSRKKGFNGLPGLPLTKGSIPEPGCLPGGHGEGANLECVLGAAGKSPGLGAHSSNPHFSAFQDLEIGAAAVMPIPNLRTWDLWLLWEFLMEK